MKANVSIPGLKRPDHNESVFETIDDLYFRGQETKAHCDIARKTFIREPLDIQNLLLNDEIQGFYSPEDDFLLTIPKKSTLQSEPFKGNVAVNQYGMDMEYAIQVDNDHYLAQPKYGSYVQNEVAPDLHKQPEITTSLKRALRNATKVNIDGKIIPGGRRFVKNTPLVCIREGKKMNVQNVDLSIVGKKATKSMNARALRNKTDRIIETLSLKYVDPKIMKDVAKTLKNHTEILKGVVSYAKKNPDFQIKLENFLKNHTDLEINMSGYKYKKGTVTGRSMENNFREKRDVTVAAALASLPTKGGLKADIDSKCFLDDRFVTPDQIEPLTSYAIPPQPVVMALPAGNKCKRFIV